MAFLYVNAAKVVYDGQTVDDQDKVSFFIPVPMCK